MPANTKIYLSNRVEILYDALVSRLFTGSHPFARRLIIVPSPAMKSWLTLRMAQDPQLQICTGVEIRYLEEGIDLLHSYCTHSSRSSYHPSSLDLAVQLEVQIKTILDEYHLMPFDKQATWKSLMDYLQMKPGHRLSKRSEKRLVSLSEKLAHLFKQYGRYGAEMLTSWEQNPGPHWQAELWNRLFSNPQLNWTYPYRQYREASLTKSIPPLQLHLFAISYLSKLQYSFLQSFSEKFGYGHYLLSPCSLFWSDTRSDKERISIVNAWRKKGLTQRQEQDLEEMLRDRNPLLANFGRLGREMLTQIEETDHICEEKYVAPEALLQHDPYRELHFDAIQLMKGQSELTLLQSLQTDMLLMRTPQKTEWIEIPNDRSIQIHIAPNKLREVEILYNTLLSIIDAHSDDDLPITPSDIVVLAPDIAEYQPYIQAIFGNRESLLDYQLMDLKAPVECRLIQAFIHLLNLPLSRWDAKCVVELFEFPHFHEKHGFSLNDIHTIRSWIDQANIRWGTDTEHRDEILGNSHCLRGMVDNNPSGTWESGFTNLIETTVYRYVDDAETQFSKSPEISITQMEILGKMIRLIRSLREDLLVLFDGTTMTLGEWADYLLCLIDCYFCQGDDDSETMLLLKKKIEQLGSSGKWVKGAVFAFSTVKKHLLAALEQQYTSYRENHVQSVKFCSMLPMRAIPSRVVCIIGMEEGAFPKQDLDITLNEMRNNEQCDYCPSQVDYDRYLFLEILLSARDYLMLSYSSLTLSEDTEHPPSLMITELTNYLDDNFRVAGKLPSEVCTKHHPYRNFDAVYFSDSGFPNYSLSNYLAAKSFYLPEKKPPHSFVGNFEDELPEKHLEESTVFIDLSELVNCVKNPLKLYFNKTLGVYLKNPEDDMLQVEETFTLSTLDNYFIKKSALKHTEEEVMAMAESAGILPMGLFKEVAEQKSAREMETVRSIVKASGTTPEEISSMIFTEECNTPYRDEEHRWILPPIVIAHHGKQVVLTGKIPYISPKGLFAYVDDTPEGIMKCWAEYVVFGCAIHRYALPIDWTLFPIKADQCKAKKSIGLDSEILLQHILDLYEASITSPSPLIPEWTNGILNGDERELEEAMKSSICESFSPIYNDYLIWSVQAKMLPSSKLLIDHWKAHAEKNFSPMYQAWFPKKLTAVQNEERDS